MSPTRNPLAGIAEDVNIQGMLSDLSMLATARNFELCDVCARIRLTIRYDRELSSLLTVCSPCRHRSGLYTKHCMQARLKTQRCSLSSSLSQAASERNSGGSEIDANQNPGASGIVATRAADKAEDSHE